MHAEHWAIASAALTLGGASFALLARASGTSPRPRGASLWFAAGAGAAAGLFGLGLHLTLEDVLGLPFSSEAIALGCTASFLAFADGIGQRRERLSQGLVASLAGAVVALALSGTGVGHARDALLAAFVALAASAMLIARRHALAGTLDLARSAAIDATGDGFAAIGSAGNLVAVNAAMIRALDLETEDGVDTPGPSLSAKVQKRIRGLIADPTRMRFTFRTRTGRSFEAWVTRGDESGPLRGLRTLVLRDITGRREAETRLMRLAHYDSLTGLPNRRFFIEQLERSVRESSEAGELAALLYVDLDRFKEINDTVGHSAGDELLRALAERFRDRICVDVLDEAPPSHRTPLIARLGGDEFAVLLSGVRDANAVEQFAARLLQLISEPVLAAERSLVSGASIGIALYPKDGLEPETLVQRADAALYAAKRLGRNRLEFYDPALTRESDRHRLIELGLRAALERGELMLAYQPKIALASEEVVGFEALLRWSSPELGPVSPAEFVPVAESRGLIGPIGAWVLGEACRQSQRWRAEGYEPVPVSVNVSSLQFSQSDLLEVVSTSLREAGTDPELLEVELTESALLNDREGVARILGELRSMGVRVAIDDFGIGYSALGHLSDIPLDTLKMDRSFVRDMENNETASGIAAAVVAMARTLRLTVVAEGVDSVGQLELLREMRCDQVQGFLYAPALKPNDAARYLGRDGRRGTAARKMERQARIADSGPDDDLPALASGPPESERRVLLLDDAERSLAPLAVRLMNLGLDVHYSSDADEARLLVRQEEAHIRMVMTPPSIEPSRLARFVRWLEREISPPPMVVVTGPEPDGVRRAELRSAGVQRVLWAPVEDDELRYWVNSAMSMPGETSSRHVPRVPVDLMAWLRVGSRRVVGVVSNLSPRGAFIEVDDPPPVGDSFRAEFELGPGRVRVFCKVLHRQTGSEESGRATGAGVEFEWLDAATADALRVAIEERGARYEP